MECGWSLVVVGEGREVRMEEKEGEEGRRVGTRWKEEWGVVRAWRESVVVDSR